MTEKLAKDDIAGFAALLESAGLPCADVNDAEWFALYGQRQDNALIAGAGIERCGDALLLRSVVTDQRYRGQGKALELVHRLCLSAKNAGHNELWLLTIDAADYFANRAGFKAVDRNQVPVGIGGSNQFTTLCPGDAILMRKLL